MDVRTTMKKHKQEHGKVLLQQIASDISEIKQRITDIEVCLVGTVRGRELGLKSTLLSIEREQKIMRWVGILLMGLIIALFQLV